MKLRNNLFINILTTGINYYGFASQTQPLKLFFKSVADYLKAKKQKKIPTLLDSVIANKVSNQYCEL